MRYVPKVPTPTSRTRSRGGNNNRNQYFAAIENCFNSSSFFFFASAASIFLCGSFISFRRPSRPNTPGSYAWASASKCAPHLRHVISDWRSESTPQTLFCPSPLFNRSLLFDYVLKLELHRTFLCMPVRLPSRLVCLYGWTG